MKRLITKEFIQWKNRENRKPLIVRGARQVGKTYSIDEFARNNFSHFLKINFEAQPELKSIFKSNNTEQILQELTILFGIDFMPNETLLFLDEIQTCPEALVSLRYFYEQQPKLHVIAAGSLLDFALNDVQYSMPVGRVEFCYLFPMNFQEFLLALSQEKLLNYIRNYSPGKAFSPVIHSKILEYLKTYFFIGGMPEAVKTFINQNKLSEVERIHSSILTTLQFDFAKYGTRKQQDYLLSVLKYSALNAGKKVKYVNIDSDVRSAMFKETFQRLQMSRIIHKITHTNANQVPLTTNENTNIFKPLFFDIGLSNHLSGIRLISLEEIFTNNQGALAEQFIGQELLTTAPPYLDSKLYYWTREAKSSNSEIDYLYQHQNRIFPIEVKSGKGGTLKSLQVYLFEKKLNTGIRYNLDLPTVGQFSVKVHAAKSEGKLAYQLLSLPLYMCFRIDKLIESILSK